MTETGRRGRYEEGEKGGELDEPDLESGTAV